MERKRIRTIIRKKIKGIAALAEDVNEGFDAEAIHAFRVAIKSLRSFLRLQKMLTGGKKIRISAKCKRLYDMVGAIREAQLEIAYWEGSKEFVPAYCAYLHLTIAQKKKEWGKYYTQSVFKKLDKKLAAIKYTPMKADAPGAFFGDRLTKALDVVNKKDVDAEQLHTARKRIKDVLYVAKMMTKEKDAVKKHDTRVPIKKLDALADLVGALNDDRTRLERLQAFIPHPDLEQERTTIEGLVRKETAAVAKNKKKVATTVRRTLASLSKATDR